MLFLKRIVDPYEYRKCDISGEVIAYGEYFYEDDEDGKHVKATVYRKIQEEARKSKFDYSLLENATSEMEYKDSLKKAEQEFLRATILDRKIADKGEVRENGID